MARRSRTHIVVLVTAKNNAEATRIAKALVGKKLAACVNILGGVSSLYRWKGKVEKGREVALIAKSVRANMPAIIALVKSLHSYAVPEIIAVPVIAGARDYLDWIDESIR